MLLTALDEVEGGPMPMEFLRVHGRSIRSLMFWSATNLLEAGGRTRLLDEPVRFSMAVGSGSTTRMPWSEKRK